MQRNCNILAYRMEKQKASKLGPAVRRFLFIYLFIFYFIFLGGGGYYKIIVYCAPKPYSNYSIKAPKL